jgi:hypothetical protein
MKIVAEPEIDNVEGTLNDVVRQAEILKDLMVAFSDRLDWKDVPKSFQRDIECASFAAWQLRDMTEALKVEYYAERFPGDRKLKVAAA